MIPIEPTQTVEAPHVDQVLAEYMQRLDRGERIDRAHFLAEHPEWVDELRAYFADCDGVAEFTEGVGLSYASPVTPLLPPGSNDSGFDFPPLGDCEIIEELAQGGMGVVYKARQYVGAGSPRPYRLVALKMMRGGRFTSSAEVRRFESEVEAVAHLDHPNIVPIHEVGQYEGRYWFSMKLVEGGSLAQHFANFRLPSAGETESGPGLVVQRQAALVELIATVARAVHYAHQRGIIHRDLKPANILLDEQGQPHVADFGLARRVPLDADALRDAESRLTQSGLIIGTPNYMAPEQARAHKALSTAADTYSLGAILYELLTGQPPFREATPLATLVKVLDHEPKPPRALNPLVDHDLETICLKCLRKEPEERYGSAAALADDLDRWRRGEPIHARPVGAVERTVKWVRRRPALAGMILLSVVSLLGGSGTALWQWARAEGELREREFSDYVRGIGLTRHERLANMGRAREHLKQCPELYRGWEWHYLDRICHSELYTLTGHEGTVIAVAVHPKGNVAASAGQDGRVICWDPRTGERLREIPTHRPGILHLAYSPDGSLLAAAAADGVITLLDADTGAERHTLRSHQKAVTCVVFHPEGQTLYSTGEDGTLRTWNVATGEGAALARFDGVLSGVAAHRDGKRVAVSGWDGHVRIWDVARGEEVFRTPARRWRWTSVAFSLDGELLAATSDEGHVQAWHVPSGKDRFRVRGPTQWMYQVAFSPDGRHLAATTEDGSVQVWDLTRAEEELFLTLRGHTRRANGLAYSPDGRLLLTGGTDGTVKVWDAVTHPEERYLGEHGIRVTALAFACSDSWLVFAGTDGALRIAESGSGKIGRTLPALPGEVRCLTVTGDDRRIICGTATGTIRVLEATNGTVLREWPAHSAAVLALFLFTADEQLLTVGADGAVSRWELATGQYLGELPAVKASLTAAAFSPDGRHLAVADPDSGIQLREVNTGRPVMQLKGEPTGVTALAFDGRSRLAATGRDRTTRIWDVGSGREVFILARHRLPARAVAFDPRGHLLATGGEDKSVRIYDGTPRPR